MTEVYRNLFCLNIPCGVSWEIKSGFDLHQLRPYIFMLILSFIIVYLFPKAQDIFDKHSKRYAFLFAIVSSVAIWLTIVKVLTNSYTTFIYFNF